LSYNGLFFTLAITCSSDSPVILLINLAQALNQAQVTIPNKDFAVCFGCDTTLYNHHSIFQADGAKFMTVPLKYSPAVSPSTLGAIGLNSFTVGNQPHSLDI